MVSLPDGYSTPAQKVGNTQFLTEPIPNSTIQTSCQMPIYRRESAFHTFQYSSCIARPCFTILQGYGYVTIEDHQYSSDGVLLTCGTEGYKIPVARNLPDVMNVALLKGASNPKNIYSSKVILVNKM